MTSWIQATFLRCYLEFRQGHNFVFADTLGFYAAALVRDDDPEPKAAVAQMIACMGTGEEELVASIGLQVSEVVAREVTRYIQFHSIATTANGLLKLHAIRPGDGATVTRALGQVLKRVKPDEDEGQERLRFQIELFPAEPDHSADITGSFLRNIVERHRTGAAGIANEDRWTLQSRGCIQEIFCFSPSCTGAQRDERLPATPAHITVAFDTFRNFSGFLSLMTVFRPHRPCTFLDFALLHSDRLSSAQRSVGKVGFPRRRKGPNTPPGVSSLIGCNGCIEQFSNLWFVTLDSPRVTGQCSERNFFQMSRKISKESIPSATG